MEYTYRFRIYPTKEQENLIQRTFGCCRFVYNHYLAMRISLYEETKTTFNYYACANDLTKLKAELEWLRDVDATALQSSLRNLETAYQNFFRSIKNKGKTGYPQFKSKHSHHQSYQSKCVGTNIKVLDKAVQLPKLGKVKCKTSKQIQGRILSATVSQSPSGRYHVAICCTDVRIEPAERTNKSVGLDLGIHSFAVSSDGQEYLNHKYLTQSEKKLAKLQRQLSRKTKGSSNYNKARLKVARLHEHISNQRKDTLHKLSTEIIKKYDVICIEDLAPANMIKNHKLAKHINDASWGEFVRMLSYKAEWYGKETVKINRFFPSSQLCSNCNTQWSGTKDLKIRKWICPECGTVLNRDFNAAINILNEGLRQLA